MCQIDTHNLKLIRDSDELTYKTYGFSALNLVLEMFNKISIKLNSPCNINEY